MLAVHSGALMPHIIVDPAAAAVVLLQPFTDNSPLNTWVHLAVTRRGSTVRGFQGGVLQFTQGGDSTLAAAHAITVGGANESDWGANHGFVGELDEFRITNGVARYTADFTPPTQPFPNP